MIIIEKVVNTTSNKKNGITKRRHSQSTHPKKKFSCFSITPTRKMKAKERKNGRHEKGEKKSKMR